MTYTVKEIFYTLQGEGANVGRPAVFCRFAGCNLWSGREEDRSAAICSFCDTDFIGTNGPCGGRYTAANRLADAIQQAWNGGPARRFVVFTGGEPLLQLDSSLVEEVRNRGFTVAVETNGTIAPPVGIDWLCVSPKARTQLRVQQGSELKVVFPQSGLDMSTLAEMAFDHFWLQPKDGPERESNTFMAIAFCLADPRWRLSVQTHKLIGIP